MYENKYHKINLKTIVYLIFIRIFGNDIFISLSNICLPLFLSLLLEIPEESRTKYFNRYIWSIIVCIIVFNILFYISSKIKKKNEKWKNLLGSVTEHISAIHVETATNIYRMHKHTKDSMKSHKLVDKSHFNKIADFQQLSFIVCKSIYDIISEQLECDECEITVYQKFPKENGKKYDTVKMIAYATKNSVIPSTYDNVYNISKRVEKTIFIQMFKSTDVEPVIFHKQKYVQENFVLLEQSKKRESTICQYIGLPIKTNSNNIVCVLQVDVSKKKVMGKNYKEVKLFADSILKPFSSILYNAYERDCVFNTLYDVWSDSFVNVK